MKYYILSGGFRYEGLDDPLGVYSSREKAEQAQEQHKNDRCYHDYHAIAERELDAEARK